LFSQDNSIFNTGVKWSGKRRINSEGDPKKQIKKRYVLVRLVQYSSSYKNDLLGRMFFHLYSTILMAGTEKNKDLQGMLGARIEAAERKACPGVSPLAFYGYQVLASSLYTALHYFMLSLLMN
jgi:hypothetical protein